MTEHQKQFTKILNTIDHSRRTYELFFDFNSLFAYTIALPFHPDIAKPKLKPLHDRYGRDKLAQFDQLVDITVDALEQEHQDFLGGLYGELELGDARSGQFFTPFHLSLMIAQMSLMDAKQLVKEKGFITIAEPAAGAGGMVIAARQVLIEQGVNPSKEVYIELTDVSEICFLMSYIQVSLYGLGATVIHGNTLTLQTFKILRTPVFFLENWPVRLFANTRPSNEPEGPSQLSFNL